MSQANLTIIDMTLHIQDRSMKHHAKQHPGAFFPMHCIIEDKNKHKLTWVPDPWKDMFVCFVRTHDATAGQLLGHACKEKSIYSRWYWQSKANREKTFWGMCCAPVFVSETSTLPQQRSSLLQKMIFRQDVPKERLHCWRTCQQFGADVIPIPLS